MPKPLDPATPQFRTALIRRLNSLAPDYAPEFAETKRGVAFRMVDSNGRPRSRVIEIARNDGHALDRSKLSSSLRKAGFPGVPWDPAADR